MLETTVRPIEDTPWTPVEPYASDSELKQSVSQTNQEQFIPMRMDLPPSLLPVHSSIFDSIPPVEWGSIVCFHTLNRLQTFGIVPLGENGIY